jgi:hypothetical protein
LKDKRWDPDADEFSRYAHSIKLPPPHDKPQVEYRPGMGSKQFFNELCAKEAGEWIFRTVGSVSGVLQGRPRLESSASANLLVPQAFERTPPGSSDDLQWSAMAHTTNFAYEFFEYPMRTSDGQLRVQRFYRTEDDLRRNSPDAQVKWKSNSRVRVPFVEAESPLSEYVYIGRGNGRPEYELNGIIVTELIVFHRESMQVLGFVRRIGAIRPAPTTFGQLSTEVQTLSCNKPTSFSSSPDFVVRVLKPQQQMSE